MTRLPKYRDASRYTIPLRLVILFPPFMVLPVKVVVVLPVYFDIAS